MDEEEKEEEEEEEEELLLTWLDWSSGLVGNEPGFTVALGRQ